MKVWPNHLITRFLSALITEKCHIVFSGRLSKWFRCKRGHFPGQPRLVLVTPCAVHAHYKPFTEGCQTITRGPQEQGNLGTAQ